MTDFSKIKTIDEAKNAEYGGKKLTRSEEKGIFDDSRLKDSSDSTKIDISKLRDAAKLLDKVKKARAKTVWNATTDQTILDELQKAKTDDDLAAKVINTVKNEDGEYLLNDVIAHLKGLKVSKSPKGSDKKGGHTLAEWISMRDGYGDQIEATKASIEEIEKEEKEYIESSVEEIGDYDEAKKHRKNVEKAIKVIKNDAIGKQILNSIVNRNKNYSSTYDSSSFVETSLGYDKNYLFAADAHDIALDVWEQIKLMDETKLFNIIDNNNHFSAANRTQARQAYDRLKDRKWGSVTNSKLYQLPGEKIVRANMWSDKKFKTGKEYESENTLVFYNPNSEINRLESERTDVNKKGWPFTKPELNDIAILMKNIFPKEKLSSNPILKSTDSGLRANEEVEISWFGFEKIPGSDEFIKFSTYYKMPGEKGSTKVKAKIGNPNGFFKIFWDTFKDDSLLVEKTMNVKDLNETTGEIESRTIERTEFEVSKKVRANLYTDNWREVIAYITRIKWIIENLREDGTTSDTIADPAGGGSTIPNPSPKLGIEFNDKWKKAAIDVGDSADLTLDAFWKEKAKSMNKELSKEESIHFALSSWQHWGVDIYEKTKPNLEVYDKFLNEARVAERKAKLVSEGDSASFAEIRNRLRRAKAEKKEAERLKKHAQSMIDQFAGMDLESLKKAFEDIYKTGPSPSNKWFPEEIDKMFSLLYDIKKKEASKSLDSKFAGYESKLVELRGKLAPHTVITQSWMSLRGTIEEKIAKQDFATDEVKERELKKIGAAFEKIEELRKLGDLEAEDYESIKEVLEGRREIPDKKPEKSDLTTDRLTKLFSFTVDETLLGKWKIVDGKTLKESDLNTIFLNEYGKGKTKFENLISHLVEKGDVDNDKAYETGDDTKKIASWEKLLNKGPEKTIKTIIIHENEDALKKDSPDETKKNELIKKMREDSATGYNKDDLTQNFFKKDRYGDPTEGSEDVSRDQLITYLFDKRIGNVKKASEAWGKSEDDNNGKETGVLAHLKANWHWYALGTLGIVILLVVVFWKNISEWWNGPAEEEGKGAEDNEKEEEENE